MKIGSIYKSKFASIVWDNPGELLLCENEKSVICILDKDDVFLILKSYSTTIEVQKYKNLKDTSIIRSIAYIMTPSGVNGWLISYNNWQDFEIIDGKEQKTMG